MKTSMCEQMRKAIAGVPINLYTSAELMHWLRVQATSPALDMEQCRTIAYLNTLFREKAIEDDLHAEGISYHTVTPWIMTAPRTKGMYLTKTTDGHRFVREWGGESWLNPKIEKYGFIVCHCGIPD